MQRGYKIPSVHSRNSGVQAAPGFTRINVAPAGEEWKSGQAAYAIGNDSMPSVRKTYRDSRMSGMDEYGARQAAIGASSGNNEMLQDAYGNRVTRNPVFKDKK